MLEQFNETGGFFQLTKILFLWKTTFYAIMTEHIYGGWNLFWLASLWCVMIKCFYVDLFLWNPPIYFCFNIVPFYPEASQPVMYQ